MKLHCSSSSLLILYIERVTLTITNNKEKKVKEEREL